MKKLLLIFILFCSKYAISQSSKQTIGNTSNEVEAKGKFSVDSVMQLPRYTDTTAANSYSNFRDTCGKLIFTYTTGDVWKRVCSPNKWVIIGAVDSATYATRIYVQQNFVPILTQNPTASLSGGTTTELHSAGTFSPNLSWSGGRLGANSSQSATANLTSIVVAGVSQTFSNPAAPGSVSGTQSVTVTYNTPVTYTNTVTTSDGKTASATTSFNFLPNRYWGISTGAPVTNDLLNSVGGGQELSNSVTKGSFTVTVSGSTKNVFYAYPSSEGTLSSIIISGLESIGAFTTGTFSFTNASNYTQTYRYYYSNNTFSSTTVSFNSIN